MRTTKVLLCAAAVAAGAISAVAQNVYSLNVVGYVNVSAPAGYSTLANPLSAGVTNGANEVMPSLTTDATGDGTAIIKFVNGAYVFRQWDFGGQQWINDTGSPDTAPTIAPGVGFFYFNPRASTQTITYVGQVVPSPGVTNSLSLPAGYSLVGSPMPVSGQVGSAVSTGNPPVPGALNLPVADGTTIIPFVNGAYDFYLFDAGSSHWLGSDGSTVRPAPTLNAGQSVFHFNPLAGAEAWLQALP